ncbi:adenylate/guanylate cyclase domain-containing protein [Rhizobium sp. TRM95796]|uniref:adenylate/guanylate cyclase domain-containing protein n=1 Tax=Rhizobium sp. TRM95796 TaxID=2979862 RepID=UPI0021E78B18|nr:adenylate/guanylate cyclase domain-containing protein [Rhizobium sp. TRM95796]MCV3768710.1 adenylate/guanylate cyclase domain-containing protein [Rhizobium sp. TRM95796]
MSNHSAHHAAHARAIPGGGFSIRLLGGELLRLAAAAVLVGNFVIGTYQRSPVHTALIVGYLVATLISFLVATRRPDAAWRQPLFVLADSVAVLLMLFMHAAQGPLDHGHALTPPGLVVVFILLINPALTSDAKLVGCFSSVVLLGWIAIIATAVANTGLGVFEALLDLEVQRELGLALSFGVTALAVYIIVREHEDTATAAETARRRGSNLARFFSPTVVDQLASDGDLQLERRQVAVMFVDLRGFTSFAESALPEHLRHMLSEFRDIVSAAVVRHGGAVDKFLGDGVMAVFGHPAPREDDADRAMACALELVDELEAWRKREGTAGRPALRAGIGLHGGTAMAGMLEPGCHSEYTVLGDVVNVAQRLQVVSKSVGANLVVLEEVKYAAPSAGSLAVWIDAKAVAIPGRRLPLDIAYV